jgi:hypothetical protein
MLKKILAILFFTPLSISALWGQDFYDSSRIQEIKIYFTQPNWRTILNANAALATEPYAVAKRVVINGVSFDSVGAKFKGNSSFRATNKKNPWHIELDHVKEQNYQGYEDIKLSNVFADPSFVREALSYELMQSYTDLPRANFTNVWVNDTLMGLYTNTEAITKTFCKKHYPSSDNNVFIKGNAPMMGGGSPSLVYLGADSSFYKRSYELNSTYGWNQLVHLCDTLNFKPAEIEKILDVDRSLWMLAFNILFVNLDSYTGGFTQNYYLWRDDNGRFNPIIWDVNMSFGSFTNIGPVLGGIGNDSLTLAKLNPFIHETNSGKPLITTLFANQRYRKMYIAHMRTMLKEVLKTGKYRTRGEQMQQLIDAAVQQDVNKFYSYALFKSNLYHGGTVSAGGPGQGVTGVVSLMENKIKYLDTLPIMQAAPPVISNVSSTPNARLNDSTWVTVKVTGNTVNGVLIGYRFKNTDIFKRVMMFDDGLHKDGAANDGIFGIGFKLNNPTMTYYIWAENANSGIFSPERAEREYHTIKAFFSVGDVVVNELMASNTKTIKDPNGQFEDWIELYNKSSAAINIGGWAISDDAYKLNKWKFPQGTSIPANGYLIVWADEDSSQNTATSLHANFKLGASGESILLTKNDGTLVDEITFGAQRADVSLARRPNGTGNFTLQTPTFNANNNTGTTTTGELFTENDLKIFPNPANTEGVTVQLNSDKNIDFSVFNTLGQTIFQGKIQGETHLETQAWQRGLYFVKVGNVSKKLVVQ